MAKSYDDILKNASPAVRKAAAAKAKQYKAEIDAAAAVRQIREASAMGQKQLADALGVSQPAVAKMEKQKDIRLSTLFSIVNAAGGSMEIRVKLPKRGAFTIPASN